MVSWRSGHNARRSGPLTLAHGSGMQTPALMSGAKAPATMGLQIGVMGGVNPPNAARVSAPLNAEMAGGFPNARARLCCAIQCYAGHG